MQKTKINVALFGNSKILLCNAENPKQRAFINAVSLGFDVTNGLGDTVGTYSDFKRAVSKAKACCKNQSSSRT